jgi:hypothetical protein
MNELTVHVEPKQNGGSVCRVVAPFRLTNPDSVADISLDTVSRFAGPEVVRHVGEGLMEVIGTNTTVAEALMIALAHPSAPPSMPICFRVADPDAHALSWEALARNANFLALDERWPIVRIARGGDIPIGATVPFAPPLRIACVLSAVGVDAFPEWTAIHAAVQRARGEGLAVEVTLLAGDQARVLDPVMALGDAQVDVGPVPADATSLLGELHHLGAHIVHLFCHGTIQTGGERILEVGTVTDFLRDDGVSSVRVRVQELGPAVAGPTTMAVILNTCRGADATDGALTHAEEVVGKGVPVAFGMRRLVESADAFEFSGALYPEILRAIRTASAGGGLAQVNWADTLLAARRKLRDIHGSDPARNDAWTLPVLYKRPGPFELLPASTKDPQAATLSLGESQTVDDLVVDVLGADAPAGLLDDLRSITN